jgi:ABC-2 type transport system permease protein
MNKLWIIAKKDIREAFRSRSTYIFLVIMVVLAFSYFSAYGTLINNLNNQGANKQTLIAASQASLNNITFVLPMMYSIFICTIFATYSVILDKAKRNIESLMATPISLKQIWLGKCIAVTLPSVIIGIGVSIIAILVMDFGFMAPQIGTLIVPEALAIVTAIILVPLLIFAIVTIVIYFQLIMTNPRIANFVFTIIFLLLFFGINALGGLGIGVNFAIIYLGFIALCAIVSLVLSRSLTKEKVLLSSKG